MRAEGEEFVLVLEVEVAMLSAVGLNDFLPYSGKGDDPNGHIGSWVSDQNHYLKPIATSSADCQM